jgi:hypothetical protein
MFGPTRFSQSQLAGRGIERLDHVALVVHVQHAAVHDRRGLVPAAVGQRPKPTEA